MSFARFKHLAGTAGYSPVATDVNGVLRKRTPAEALADIGAAASAHSHAIADVTGLQTALDARSLTSHNHTLDSLSNTTITSVATGEILKWNGTAWVNNTLAEAGIQPLDADLTAIAQISGAGILEKNGSGWGLRPIDLQTSMEAGSSGKWAKIITLAWGADTNETFSAKLDLVSGMFSIGASQYLIGVDIDRDSGISSFVVKQINGYNFSANRLVAVVTSNAPNAIVVEIWTKCPANYSHIMWNLSSVLKNQYGSNTTLNITQHQGASWNTSYSSGTVFTGS